MFLASSGLVIRRRFSDEVFEKLAANWQHLQKHAPSVFARTRVRVLTEGSTGGGWWWTLSALLSKLARIRLASDPERVRGASRMYLSIAIEPQPPQSWMMYSSMPFPAQICALLALMACSAKSSPSKQHCYFARGLCHVLFGHVVTSS